MLSARFLILLFLAGFSFFFSKIIYWFKVCPVELQWLYHQKNYVFFRRAQRLHTINYRLVNLLVWRVFFSKMPNYRFRVALGFVQSEICLLPNYKRYRVPRTKTPKEKSVTA